MEKLERAKEILRGVLNAMGLEGPQEGVRQAIALIEEYQKEVRNRQL